MQKTVIVLLVAATVAAPFHFLYAQEMDSNEELSQQLVAVSRYLKRVLTLDTTPLTETELRRALQDGSAWLSEAQEKSGHFRYEYVPYENRYREDDNIVRQAGALYALGEIARRDHGLSYVNEETILQAITFFEGVTRQEMRDGQNFKCIAKNSVSYSCTLGATSLALSGILGYLEVRPEKITEFQKLVEGYANYILAMKKTGEGFRHMYRTNRVDQDDEESSFSNGEALLALVRYYTFDPRDDVKVAIDDAYDYLSSAEYDVPLYLWIMAALKDMYMLWGNEQYITYGEAYTDWRVSRAVRFRGNDKNFCAYTEGIASAYSLLEDHYTSAQKATLKAEIDYWNRRNATLQLTSDDMYRVLTSDDNVVLGHLDAPDRAFGGFLTGEREPTERIDFTQHCLGTYVQTLVDIEEKTL